MTSSMHTSLATIGRQLRAEYFPAVGKPLPRELEDLLAQLVAREVGTQGSTEQSVDVLQPAIAQLRARS